MKKRKKTSNILSSCLVMLLAIASGFFCGYAVIDYAGKLSGGTFINLLVDTWFSVLSPAMSLSPTA